MKKISIIAAVADNNVIGGDNALLWSIPEDLKRFKELTTGHTIIMGRKTFESIGRPLPNRQNVVVSRDKNLKIDGVEVVSSIKKAMDLCPNDREIFVIGGGEIYKKVMPKADKLYITHVHNNFTGDTLFPSISPRSWKKINSEILQTNKPYIVEVVDYSRIRRE